MRERLFRGKGKYIGVMECIDCKYYFIDELGDRYCTNYWSKHCSEYVNKDFSCNCWQEGKK